MKLFGPCTGKTQPEPPTARPLEGLEELEEPEEELPEDDRETAFVPARAAATRAASSFFLASSSRFLRSSCSSLRTRSRRALYSSLLSSSAFMAASLA